MHVVVVAVDEVKELLDEVEEAIDVVLRVVEEIEEVEEVDVVEESENDVLESTNLRRGGGDWNCDSSIERTRHLKSVNVPRSPVMQLRIQAPTGWQHA